MHRRRFFLKSHSKNFRFNTFTSQRRHLQNGSREKKLPLSEDLQLLPSRGINTPSLLARLFLLCAASKYAFTKATDRTERKQPSFAKAHFLWVYSGWPREGVVVVAFSSLFLRLSTNSRHNSFVVILVIFPSSFFASFFESILKLKAVKQRTPRPPLLQTSGGRACFFCSLHGHWIRTARLGSASCCFWLAFFYGHPEVAL